ncbi:MAG: catalase [Bacteroidales bacterium]|jgi:catalase|nr:catalase [Bacteroidales bacterium]MDX9925877.1 catalase [Bacteroidales bacterium]HNX82879.1 catalase [Bacteroidales bacterium]HOC48524.1 catalase [Bacteroidales bacterium]HPS97105.1 catalase [Bacteroidales bacterium]
MKKKKLTTAAGRPYFENEDSMTAGPRGPVLLQDYYLHEKLAHFNRERIPERVVHAKGTGAFGTFTVTGDITKYTRARLFSKVGNKCRVFVRFSTVGGEKGSADTERDPRGFAVKFYTEEGNWDLVGNNTPVFFIKDAKKFPDFIHTQKRDPKTNLKSDTMQWDFWSLNPESLHQLMTLFSDRGTPDGYRFMNGYGSHTFSMYNKKNERVWVKFHFKTQQGNKTLTRQQAEEIKGKDPDYSQRDLVNAIAGKDYPKWTLKIQVMTDAQAKKFKWNPFDVTKVWPHKEFPLIEAGVMELNEIPENYFADVEQAAFAPAHTVDGIGLSPDKMLQGRIFAYPDAHRYRLGANYQQIPVNRPIAPVSHHQRDGHMTVDGNQGSGPNYFPNSFDNIEADKNYREAAMALDSDVADYFDRNKNDNDHYSQAGALFRKVMTDQERANTVGNLVCALKGVSGPKKKEILMRQLEHFHKADKELAQLVAKGLGIKFPRAK